MIFWIYISDGRRNVTKHSRKHDNLPVVEAASYILSKKNSDYGWEDFTPRALIALKFAEKILPISEEERALMKKRLDVNILLNLVR